MEKKTKKDWKKPELIVLVRSKPEEAVLAFCKNVSGYARTNGHSCKNPNCNLSTTIGS
jgi:hypothetical protein